MFQRSDLRKQSQSIKDKRQSKCPDPIIQEDMLARLPLSSSTMQSVIESLISDDLYPQQSASFPNFHHRSTKLACQGSMLSILILFDATILKQDSVKMRQIVDRFFCDNWVVPLYNGVLVDLSIEWNNRFPAAQSALSHVVSMKNVHQLQYSNAKLILKCTDDIKMHLMNNTMSDMFVLDNGSDLLNIVRKTNVSLRWHLLHSTSFTCIEADIGGTKIIDENDFVNLLLLASQFEMQLKDAYERLLQAKLNIWQDCKDKAVREISHVSICFSGQDTLAKVEKNEGLMEWFQSMVDEIESLSINEEEHFTMAGRNIQLCVQALDDITQFDLVDRNEQIKGAIAEARVNLFHMVKIVGINEDICAVIASISTFSYAREAIESYIGTLHKIVMQDPKSVSFLRPFFIKMSSFLQMPSARLVQSHGSRRKNDLLRLAEFYELAMLSFVKQVLDVIPTTMFSTLGQIVEMNEKSLINLPPKIEVESLSEYAQNDDRYRLARITFELAVVSEGENFEITLFLLLYESLLIVSKGIFGMQSTMIGGMEINPRNLLDEGLRKELVRQLSAALHYNLQFKMKEQLGLKDHQDVCIRVFNNLERNIDGFRRALSWLQDYLRIDGMAFFSDEITRVIVSNIE